MMSPQLKFIETALLGLHRASLRDKYGAITVTTGYPVALQSPDHIYPWGTAQDNSRNERFNAKLISLVPNLSVLDLGCSGGGMVRSFIEQGYLAVGIEGSDYSRKALRAEWLTIPEYLFTADITKPFYINAKFQVITLWEVIEHIAEDDLPIVLANIAYHLEHDGLVIMSVSPKEDIVNGVRLHQTVHDRAWWEEMLLKAGWINHQAIVDYFGADMVRSEPNASGSFHFALGRVRV